MTVAYLFPGQGAQAVGMGKDLYDAVPAAKAIFDEADEALGFSLSQLCFEGPMEDLTQTINTQPAILTASVATFEAAREILGDKGLTPAYTAGHSLGEYSSLVAAGSMTFSDAVKLVRERGRLMQAAGDAQPGAMAAVMGMPEDQLQAICEANGIDMANLNSAEQIVISGSKEGVEAAQKAAEEGGARRVVPLPVSAAFHSSLMDPAVPGMRTALEGAAISAPTYPVVGNVTAQPLETADEVIDELARQIRSSVQWFRTVEYLRDNSVTTFIEMGPGKVLTGLVKRTFAEAEIINVGNLEELEALKA